MITAICPGTYDPVTLGHVDVIRRAAAIFDRVVVGVVREPHHKQTLFTVEERVAFLEDALAGIDNVDRRRLPRARRRLRAQARREDDGQGAARDRRLRVGVPDEPAEPPARPEIETMYVMSSPQYSFISSSGVKEIASFGGKVDELVPEAVARRFRELFPNGRPGAPLSPQE